MNDSKPDPHESAGDATDEPNTPREIGTESEAAAIAEIVASQDRRGEIFFWIGIVIVLGIVLGVAHEFHLAARSASPAGPEAGFPLDDAWIHQVYARAFARTGAFEYNPGESEVGLSSPLFGALQSTLYLGAERTLEELIAGVRWIGAGCWFLLALAAALVARAIPTPLPRVAGFAAAILVALEPRFGFAAGSGMEPLLFGALCLFATERALRDSWWLAGVACALALLTRPEGAVLVPVLAIAAIATRSSGRRVAAVAAVSIPATLAACGWMLHCLDVSGRPLPNTFYAKSEWIPISDAVTAFGAIWTELVVESPYYRVPTTYLLLALAIIGVFARGRARVAVVAVFAPLALAAGLALSRTFPLASAFYWSRYFLPIGGFACVLLGIGIAATLGTVFDILRRRFAAVEDGNQVPAPISAILLVVLAVLPFGAVAQSIRDAIESFGKQVADVDRTNVAAARWLGSDETLPPDTVIGAQDAGAVRYFGAHPVVDLLGLNDHRLIAAERAGGGEGVKAYLLSRNPRGYFLLDPDPGATEFARLARESGLVPMQRFEAPDYSLFGAPYPKGVVLYLPGR